MFALLVLTSVISAADEKIYFRCSVPDMEPLQRTWDRLMHQTTPDEKMAIFGAIGASMARLMARLDPTATAKFDGGRQNRNGALEDKRCGPLRN